MKRAVRLRVLAGLISSAAMMTADVSAADVSAQGCPAWLSWACRDYASSTKGIRKDANTASKRIRKEVSQGTGAAAARPKQTQALNRPRAARNGERRPMSDQEKQALFEQFLEWKRGRGQDTGTIQ
jgi:hypothetical protein